MQLAKSLTSYDILLGLLAAATHDLDHPGVNQPFLIKTDHYLASLYRVRQQRSHAAACLTFGIMCYYKVSLFDLTEYLSSGKPPLEVCSGSPQRDGAVLSFTHRGQVSGILEKTSNR